MNLGPVQEQQVPLISEPSLQPLFYFSKIIYFYLKIIILVQNFSVCLWHLEIFM